MSDSVQEVLDLFNQHFPYGTEVDLASPLTITNSRGIMGSLVRELERVEGEGVWPRGPWQFIRNENPETRNKYA